MFGEEIEMRQLSLLAQPPACPPSLPCVCVWLVEFAHTNIDFVMSVRFLIVRRLCLLCMSERVHVCLCTMCLSLCVCICVWSYLCVKVCVGGGGERCGGEGM